MEAIGGEGRGGAREWGARQDRSRIRQGRRRSEKGEGIEEPTTEDGNVSWVGFRVEWSLAHSVGDILTFVLAFLLLHAFSVRPVTVQSDEVLVAWMVAKFHLSFFSFMMITILDFDFGWQVFQHTNIFSDLPIE